MASPNLEKSRVERYFLVLSLLLLHELLCSLRAVVRVALSRLVEYVGD